jgi:hypothetical protein
MIGDVLDSVIVLGFLFLFACCSITGALAFWLGYYLGRRKWRERSSGAFPVIQAEQTSGTVSN